MVEIEILSIIKYAKKEEQSKSFSDNNDICVEFSKTEKKNPV